MAAIAWLIPVTVLGQPNVELVYVGEFGSFGTNVGQFNRTRDVAVDSQNRIIIADRQNNRIQVCDDQGNCTSFGSDGPEVGNFSLPQGVAVDSHDHIIVADLDHQRIQICDDLGNCTSFGSRGTGDGQFVDVQGVDTDSNDRIFVADGGNSDNSRVANCDHAGNCDYFDYHIPADLEFDKQDRLIITDEDTDYRISICDDEGSCESFGKEGTGVGEFNKPRGVAVDDFGTIYIADTFNHRIQACDYFGNCKSFGGSLNTLQQSCSDSKSCATSYQPGDGPGQFDRPGGVEVDKQGRLIVADTYNHRIQIFKIINQGFNINAAMSDAWFFPDTSGQGFFIIVWEDSKLIFMSWFTYDTERPPEDITAILGEPGHRWLTALGPYEGDTAVLDVFLSSGMIFDSADPPVDTVAYEGATIEIVWSDCKTGLVKYNIPSLGLMGEIPIQRIVEDKVAACEAAQAQ